jgi:hypothetical protein
MMNIVRDLSILGILLLGGNLKLIGGSQRKQTSSGDAQAAGSH